MGVPAFFRWLSRKYPSILVHCLEEKPKEVDGVNIPVDTSKPNPNDVEFDNLYLDMNGIIHPCTHPENKPAPKNEEEMMLLIFEYIDRIFSNVRPRRVLYMAIDGVAPRAKMNQQRSRRFRASKEYKETAEKISEAREELLQKGAILPPEKPASEKFDSNCITPGTPFMFRLANNLRYYIHDRLNNDPGWKDIKVILSDANVPGEGEHKIMDYIRRQRAQPDHDPNTAHCLCGADADLIMLGLATHEPNFTIIREEFKPNMDRPCILCGQIGHAIEECTGLPKEKSGEFDHIQSASGEDTPFIFLRLNILKEYLEKELKMDGLPFKYEFERALDDWVFMCFFVGNDFLPHLPSLEIREGAIDRLIKLYKNAVYKTGGYLTDSGEVALERVQLIMQELGKAEDEIFKKRRIDDVSFRKRMKDKNKRMNRGQNKPRYTPRGMCAPQPLGRGRPGLGAVQNPRQEAYQGRMQGMSTSVSTGGNVENLNNAVALKSLMSFGNQESNQESNQQSNQQFQQGQKRKHEQKDEDSEPEDNVKLWEDGFKDRYYKRKFDVEEEDMAFRHMVADHYVRGLCWVLRYYYQGCASWKWYFPYHYAPFASDFVNISRLSNDFEKDTEPFKPLEQLMGVFPAGSKQHVPQTWQNLMTDPESPIIDFYPINFKIDKNGKKYDWQGVALLPFVDETRLWKALDTVYPDLTVEEKHRNGRGNDRLFVNNTHPVHSMLEALYEGVSKKLIKKGKTEQIDINPEKTQGMAGKVFCDEFVVLTGETFPSPIPELASVLDNRVISVQYKDPQFEANFVFKAEILPNATPMPRVLKPEDFENFNRGNNWFRPQLGFQPNSGYRGHKNMGPANRMISAGTGVPPPSSYDSRGGYGNRGGYRGGRGNNQGGGGYNQGGGYSRHNQGGGGYSRGGGGGYSRDGGSYSTGKGGGYNSGGGGGYSRDGGSYSTGKGGGYNSGGGGGYSRDGGSYSTGGGGGYNSRGGGSYSTGGGGGYNSGGGGARGYNQRDGGGGYNQRGGNKQDRNQYGNNSGGYRR